MTQGKVVVSGTVEASYTVLAYDMGDGETMYDVMFSNGGDSEQLFYSVEEAEEYAVTRLAG